MNEQDWQRKVHEARFLQDIGPLARQPVAEGVARQARRHAPPRRPVIADMQKFVIVLDVVGWDDPTDDLILEVNGELAAVARDEATEIEDQFRESVIDAPDWHLTALRGFWKIADAVV